MKHCLKFLFATLLTITSIQEVFAVDIVECEDQEGNRSFLKNCPPGTTQVGSKTIHTGSSSTSSKYSNIEATLYVIPKCEACDEVREFLQAKGVSFNEKNANESIEIQQEITRISGGLKIPTTVIGKDVIVGYKRSQFEDALAKINGDESTPSSDAGTEK